MTHRNNEKCALSRAPYDEKSGENECLADICNVEVYAREKICRLIVAENTIVTIEMDFWHAGCILLSSRVLVDDTAMYIQNWAVRHRRNRGAGLPVNKRTSPDNRMLYRKKVYLKNGGKNVRADA